MSTYKFAVIGCGNIGKRHLAVIDANPRAVLAGYCDIDASNFSHLSKLYPGVPQFEDHQAMLDSLDADIINVCTPHHLHAPMTIAAANTKRHILVEKPMTLDTASGEAMIKAAKANGVQLYVMKQNRYNVPIQLTKEVLDSGALGRIFKVQCNVLWNRSDAYYQNSPWRGRKDKEGGALFTQGSHFVDLIVWWFGMPASIHTVLKKQQHDIDFEDNGTALFEFQGDTMGVLNWTNNVYNKNYEGSITIIAEKGTIKIGGQYLNRIEYWDVQSHPLQEGVSFVDQPNVYGKYQGTSSNHDKVIDDLINNLSDPAIETVQGEEGLLTVNAIESIYKAVSHG